MQRKAKQCFCFALHLLCINFAPNMLQLAHFHFVQVRRRLGNKNESFKFFVLYCARLALTLPLDYKTIYEFNSRHWQFLCQSRRVRWRQYGDAQTAGRRSGRQHCHDSRRIQNRCLRLFVGGTPQARSGRRHTPTGAFHGTSYGLHPHPTCVRLRLARNTRCRQAGCGSGSGILLQRARPVDCRCRHLHYIRLCQRRRPLSGREHLTRIGHAPSCTARANSAPATCQCRRRNRTHWQQHHQCHTRRGAARHGLRNNGIHTHHDAPQTRCTHFSDRRQRLSLCTRN